MATRRQLLAATGIAAATSGCVSALGDDSEPESTDESTEPDTVRLGKLSVQNNDDEDHQVQLAVEGDGSVLHLGTYDFDSSGSSTTVEGNWNQEADSYRIHARLGDSEIKTADVTDGISENTDCVRVLVRIDVDGNLGIWNGADCDN